MTVRINKKIWMRHKTHPYKLNIKWSKENVELCDKAKKEIEKANPEEALRLLSKIDSTLIEDRITILVSRWAKYKQDVILGILTEEDNRTRFNRINSDVLDLINHTNISFEKAEQNHIKIFDFLKKRYIGRLNQALGNRKPINLRLIPSTVGTSEETNMAFVPISPRQIQLKVYQAFLRAYGRMLIVGEPGVGKTCLLLQLVVKLLETQQFAIPVIINLATWNKSYITLENWLEEVIPFELGVNKAFAKKIIYQSEIIVLLDGFDEVKAEDRLSCLTAIGRYGERAEHQFVICSRIKEYKQVEKDAAVNFQIEVGKLTFEQIKAELEIIGYSEPGALPLLIAIEKDNQLREVVKTPFYFNILQLLFSQGKRLSELRIYSKTIIELQEEILERFVNEQLISGDIDKFDAKSSQKWLAFLARRMTQRNMVAFELSDLQYDWWKWSHFHRFLGGFVKGVVNSLLLGLICFLLIPLIVFLFSDFLNSVKSVLIVVKGFFTFLFHVGISSALLSTIRTPKGIINSQNITLRRRLISMVFGATLILSLSLVYTLTYS